MRPTILISNDDGIDATGIKALTDIASKFGDVIVVAPNSPRSGMSSAITANHPIRLELVSQQNGITQYKSSGTPVDCIKLAMSSVLTSKPTLILSGINHGANIGISTIYSGTMGIANEGAIIGVPSIGFSLCSHEVDPNYTAATPYIEEIIDSVLKNGLPKNICLNVNIPYPNIKGLKVCTQTEGYWSEEFEKRVDPYGKEYYWITGIQINAEPENQNNDTWAVENGFISVVPSSINRSVDTGIQHLLNLQK